MKLTLETSVVDVSQISVDVNMTFDLCAPTKLYQNPFKTIFIENRQSDVDTPPEGKRIISAGHARCLVYLHIVTSRWRQCRCFQAR